MEKPTIILRIGNKYKLKNNQQIKVLNFWYLGFDIKEVVSVNLHSQKVTRVTKDDFMSWIDSGDLVKTW